MGSYFGIIPPIFTSLSEPFDTKLALPPSRTQRYDIDANIVNLGAASDAVGLSGAYLNPE